MCYNEGAPLQTSSPSCNSTALAPRDLSLVHDLPSQDLRPNGGYYPAAQSRFGRFLALTVPSAEGLVTHVPLRLYPDEKSFLQRTATRRHRTQCYKIFPIFVIMVLNIFPAFFAKYIPLRKHSKNDRISVYPSLFVLSIWTCEMQHILPMCSGSLARQRLPAFFAKEYTLRKFLCHFLDRKRTPFGVLFTLFP